MSNGQRWRRSYLDNLQRGRAPTEVHVLTFPHQDTGEVADETADLLRELEMHATDRTLFTFDRNGATFTRVTMLDENGNPSALSDEFEHIDVDSITEVEVVRELNAYGITASTAALASQNRQMLRIVRALLPRVTAS